MGANGTRHYGVGGSAKGHCGGSAHLRPRALNESLSGPVLEFIHAAVAAQLPVIQAHHPGQNKSIAVTCAPDTIDP
jgi:hypothetical protein